MIQRIKNLFSPKKEERAASPYIPTYSTVTSPTSVYGYGSLQVAAVYACIKVNRDTVSSLSKHIYKYDQEKRSRADHPFNKIIARPNPYNTWNELMDLFISSYYIRGNGYLIVMRDKYYEISGLYWANPDRMILYKDEQSGEMYYYNQDTQSIHGPENVIHIKELWDNPYIGTSRVDRHSKTIGKLKASDDMFNKLTTSGLMLGGVFVYPNDGHTVDPAVMVKQESRFNQLYAKGTDSFGQYAFLQGGPTVTQFQPGMTLSSAQVAEVTNLTIESICSIFGVPPHKIQHLVKSSYKSFEQLQIDHIQGAILPLVRMIEQQIDRVVFNNERDKDLHFKFDIESLLQADTIEQIKVIKEAISTALLSPNEGRAILNKNPIEGGDNYFYPSNNLTPLQFADQIDYNLKKPANETE